jgi:putative transposase
MRSLPHWRWHLDEVFVKINGERHHLWRAVDYEGEVLESLVTKTRDKKTALKFLAKTLKRHGRSDEIVTDRLQSYGAALREPGINDKRDTDYSRRDAAPAIPTAGETANAFLKADR